MDEQGCMRLISGRVIDLAQFDEKDVCLSDIAHSLSRICRFNGHIHGFRSVAAHSLDVGARVALFGPQVELLGLLHDAHEAYTGDIIRPVKSFLSEDYRDLVQRVQVAIHRSLVPVLPDKYEEWEQINGWISEADEVSLFEEMSGTLYYSDEMHATASRFCCEVERLIKMLSSRKTGEVK